MTSEVQAGTHSPHHTVGAKAGQASNHVGVGSFIFSSVLNPNCRSFRAELVTPDFQGMVWDHRPGHRESGETNHRGRPSGGRAEKIEEKSPFHRCPSPHGRCQSASKKSSTPASEESSTTLPVELSNQGSVHWHSLPRADDDEDARMRKSQFLETEKDSRP